MTLLQAAVIAMSCGRPRVAMARPYCLPEDLLLTVVVEEMYVIRLGQIRLGQMIELLIVDLSLAVVAVRRNCWRALS